jgi:RNA polymerase sigma factor (sigma-70 family)
MNEEELLVLAQNGDTEAFGRLIDMRGAVVYRLCFAILRSRADAEDAAQETFLAAWKDLRGLRSRDAWLGWLRRIAIRKAIEADRQRRRLAKGFVIASNSEDRLSTISERDAMERAFGLLPVEERAVLALRYYIDLEVPDAATALGIPLGTAKSRIHRGLNRLRAAVEDLERDE